MSIQTAWHSEARDKYKGADGLPANHDRAMAEAVPLSDGATAWVAAVADGCGGDNRGTLVAQLSLDRLRVALAGATVDQLSHQDTAMAWSESWSRPLQNEILQGPLRGGNSTLCAGIIVADSAEPGAYRLLMLNVGDSPALLFLGPTMEQLGAVPDAPRDNPNVADNGKSLVRAIGLAARPGFPMLDVNVSVLSPSSMPCVLIVSSDGAVAYRDLQLLYPRDYKRIIAEGCSDFNSLPRRLLDRSLEIANQRGFHGLDNSTVAMLGLGLERGGFIAPAPVATAAAALPATPSPSRRGNSDRGGMGGKPTDDASRVGRMVRRSWILPTAIASAAAAMVIASMVLWTNWKKDPDRLPPRPGPGVPEAVNAVADAKFIGYLPDIECDFASFIIKGKPGTTPKTIESGKGPDYGIPPPHIPDGADRTVENLCWWYVSSASSCDECKTNSVHKWSPSEKYVLIAAPGTKNKVDMSSALTNFPNPSVSWTFASNEDFHKASVILNGSSISNGVLTALVPVHTNVSFVVECDGYTSWTTNIPSMCFGKETNITIPTLETAQQQAYETVFMATFKGDFSPVSITGATNSWSVPEPGDWGLPMPRTSSDADSKGKATCSWYILPSFPCEDCRSMKVELTVPCALSGAEPKTTNVTPYLDEAGILKKFLKTSGLSLGFARTEDRDGSRITVNGKPVPEVDGSIFIPVHTLVEIVVEKDGYVPLTNRISSVCFKGKDISIPVLQKVEAPQMPAVFVADFKGLPDVVVSNGGVKKPIPSGSGVEILPDPAADKPDMCQWMVSVSNHCDKCKRVVSLQHPGPRLNPVVVTNRVDLSPLDKFKTLPHLSYRGEPTNPPDEVWIRIGGGDWKKWDSNSGRVPVHTSIDVKASKKDCDDFVTNVISLCYAENVTIEIPPLTHKTQDLPRQKVLFNDFDGQLPDFEISTDSQEWIPIVWENKSFNLPLLPEGSTKWVIRIREQTLECKCRLEIIPLPDTESNTIHFSQEIAERFRTPTVVLKEENKVDDFMAKVDDLDEDPSKPIRIKPHVEHRIRISKEGYEPFATNGVQCCYGEEAVEIPFTLTKAPVQNNTCTVTVPLELLRPNGKSNQLAGVFWRGADGIDKPLELPDPNELLLETVRKNTTLKSDDLENLPYDWYSFAEKAPSRGGKLSVPEDAESLLLVYVDYEKVTLQHGMNVIVQSKDDPEICTVTWDEGPTLTNRLKSVKWGTSTSALSSTRGIKQQKTLADFWAKVDGLSGYKGATLTQQAMIHGKTLNDIRRSPSSGSFLKVYEDSCRKQLAEKLDASKYLEHRNDLSEEQTTSIKEIFQTFINKYKKTHDETPLHQYLDNLTIYIYHKPSFIN